MTGSVRILVTGGSGFIGTHLVKALVNSGFEVLNFDINPPRDSSQDSTWQKANLLNLDQVKLVFSEFQPKYIFNLAAETDISKPKDQFAVNTIGLSNILDAADAVGIAPHLVHASTQLVMAPGHTPANERDLAPYSEYGETKAESEAILWRYTGRTSWTVIRPTTIWGAWHSTFPKTIWKYIERRWYMMPTGIDPIRSYGYVGNIIDQMMSIISTKANLNGKALFVGDEPMRSSEWLDGFSEALTGKRIRRVPGSLLHGLAELGEFSGRLGGPSPINRGRLFRMSSDYPVPMDETFRLLGRGSTKLGAGIEATVNWIRAQA